MGVVVTEESLVSPIRKYPKMLANNAAASGLSRFLQSLTSSMAKNIIYATSAIPPD